MQKVIWLRMHDALYSILAHAESLTDMCHLCADVGSGRTNGADGPGKPDGGAAPSGTNAGAVNPPPGSSGKRLF